jgi:hypothetical protein
MFPDAPNILFMNNIVSDVLNCKKFAGRSQLEDNLDSATSSLQALSIDMAAQGSRDAGKVPSSLCSSHLAIYKGRGGFSHSKTSEQRTCDIPIHLEVYTSIR